MMAHRLTEIVHCPICLLDFKDPRSLSCLHSFCFQCLQGLYCKVHPGDDVQCPVCRKEFQIPLQGLKALPHNFFLQNLVDVKNTEHRPTAGTSSCEPCSREGRTKTATKYCTDCSQKLCDRCSVPHKNWRGGPHDVRPMGDELSTELIWLRGSYCDKHPDKRLELYCFECRRNICMKCCVVSHQQHKCEEIEKVAKKFVPSIQSDIKPIPSRISQLREAVKQVELANERFLDSIKKIELEVQRKGNELKRIVDDHTTHLLEELSGVKVNSVKQSKTHVESFELALIALESFHAYSTELAAKGSACDITRAANDLHVRAEELLKTCATYGEYSHPKVEFGPTNIERVTGGDKNIIGSLQISNVAPTASPMSAGSAGLRVLTTPPQRQTQDNIPQPLHHQRLPSGGQPSVIHTIPKAEYVWGVTLLNDEVYVLRDRHSEQIDIYSTTDFALLGRLSVKGLSRDMMDITSCVQKQCVYIADRQNTCIHRVGLDKSVSKWRLRAEPHGLSVTRSSNLLITCCNKRGQNGKLLELTSKHGKLEREVTLKTDIEWPEHSVQLTNSQYVVCHSGGISLFGSDGKFIRSNRGDAGLHLPYHVSSDGGEFIFVGDNRNKQIVMFDSSLNYIRNVLERMPHGPKRLCFDDSRRLLYVGQDGGIVTIVQL